MLVNWLLPNDLQKNEASNCVLHILGTSEESCGNIEPIMRGQRPMYARVCALNASCKALWQTGGQPLQKLYHL